MSEITAECSSSSPDWEDVSRSAALIQPAASLSLRRKRVAAARLPRISFSSSSTHVNNDTATTSDSVGKIASVSSHECLHEDDVDLKRQRVTELGQLADPFALDIAEGQSRSPYGSSDREESPKLYRVWPSVNNTVVCGYQLVGAGKEFNAFHLETKAVKTCQLIDNEQYKKVLKIRECLNGASKYWKHEDLNEMREFVLPSSVEIHEDDQGRRFMFSPWQYGTLQGKVQANKNAIPELEVQPLFAQVVRGIAFCHAIGIVVRDLKLRKFIFTDKKMSRLRLHDVFDLVVCTEVNNDGICDRHSCPAYVAPEILMKGPAEYAGRSADIWALGVLLYVLLFGSYPFNDATPQRLFSRILKVRFSMPQQPPVSQAARILIYSMLRKEPSERPTAEQLLFVPWLTAEPENIAKSYCLTRTPYLAAAGAMAQATLSSSLATTVASSARISAALTPLTPTMQLQRFLNYTVSEEDQLVPCVSSAVLTLQRQIKCIRDILSNSSLFSTAEQLNITEGVQPAANPASHSRSASRPGSPAPQRL